MPELPELLNRRVSELIEDVAAPTPAPAGGSVAALVVTLAAGLVPAVRATRVPPIDSVREGSTAPPSRAGRHAVIVAVAVLGVASTVPSQVSYYRSRRMTAVVRGLMREGGFDAVITHAIRVAPHVPDVPRGEGAGRGRAV